MVEFKCIGESMRLLFFHMISGALVGLLSGLLPGIHPMLFPLSHPVAVGIAYGLFTVLSILPVLWFMYVDPDNFASTNAVARLSPKGWRYITSLYAWGVMLAIPLMVLALPFHQILEVQLPCTAVFVYLVLLSLLLILKSGPLPSTAFLATLSGFLGLLALRAPLGVKNPLIPLIAGLFGFSELLISKERSILPGTEYTPRLEDLGAVVAGVLSGLLVSYFPAVSISLALLLFPLFEGYEGFIMALGAATISSYFFSVFGRLEGLVRTSLAAALPTNELALLALPSLLVGVSLGVLFMRLLTHVRVPTAVALVIVPLCVFYVSGLSGLILLAGSTALGALARMFGVQKRVLSFAIIVPTLFFYAPM